MSNQLLLERPHTASDTLGFASRSIHGAGLPDPTTGAVVAPIYQSTTFAQESLGVHKGYPYSRAANPTVHRLEVALGALENAPPAACATMS